MLNAAIRTHMTERLYYTDSYRQTFDARLAALTSIGDRPAAVLDQTYFYPTSGGQLHDTGKLAGVDVIDVVAGEDGLVYHLMAAPLAAALGDIVTGTIDWPRRYDHMQQHSGQHLLSQVCYRLFGYETVSVHFGAQESTMDLDVAEMSTTQLAEAEAYANDLVYAALPLRAYFVHDSELGTVPLRRPPKVSGQIRIVEIDAFDYSACGGTHVHTTGEIGPLKLTRQERRRNQVRLTFLCGKRALADYERTHRLLNSAALLFSAESEEVPALIERSLTQNKALQRQLEAANAQLLHYEAAEMAKLAETVTAGDGADALRIVSRIFTDRDANDLKGLAAQLQQQPNLVALLGSTAGEKLSVVFACSMGLPLNMGQLLRTTLAPFNGKGGGRAELAQGGLADAGAGAGEAVLAAARRLLAQSHNEPVQASNQIG